MHRLDNRINDIDYRIVAVCKNVPNQEEVSLQEALCSYGWILLDSWVAWRTLRFILRDANIDDRVHEKWFQTPSSYRASQIKAIWGFTEATENYVKMRSGCGLKEAIDGIIQSKRNDSAHFTRKMGITGQDFQRIEQLHGVLSTIFLLYESFYFFSSVRAVLEKQGYTDFVVEFFNGERCALEKFQDGIENLSFPFNYLVLCDKGGETGFVISISANGCKAGRNLDALKSVSNEKCKFYDFTKNKGYYRDVDLFVDTILKCWGGLTQ